ncbi:hypothetical protein ElyMa_006456300 [Elysia marginata]|uniref:Uncharacterized protein n=1 Tax=Elysia marginata TaxID=1093978 RepID=A0AAV4I1T2_9GAST|nr:hypothetical protein ElyMa_006456300 [Elysia marginata]
MLTSTPPFDDIIDLTGYYHCEINDINGNRILKSNRIFIQPRDVEIFSAHFRLAQPTDPRDWSLLQHQLMFGVQGGPRVAGQRLISNLSQTLDDTLGYRIKPLALQSGSRTLVAYAYRPLTVPFIPDIINDTPRVELQALANTVCLLHQALSLRVYGVVVWW